MKSFNEIYGKVYNESSKQLENARQKVQKEIVTVVFVAMIIGTFLSVLTQNIIFICVTLLMVCLYVLISLKDRDYTKMFKDRVIKTFVKEYSSTLDFLPDSGVSRTIYYEGEFENFDRYKTEDLIIGSFEDGTKIKMGEVVTEREIRDEEGHTSYTKIFHGLFAEIEIDKYVPANIKIRRNIILSLDMQYKLYMQNKLDMDSSEFEKNFNVYSEDKIITMQLLTADVMQMLIDFKNKTKLTPEITIKESSIYIRFPTGPIFETKITKDSLDFDTLLKYYEIINFTLKLSEGIIKNIKETEL